jgi:hypothetical protein
MSEEILSIFPDIEKELAETLLAENDGNVEETIDFLLNQTQNQNNSKSDAQLAQTLADEGIPH